MLVFRECIHPIRHRFHAVSWVKTLFFLFQGTATQIIDSVAKNAPGLGRWLDMFVSCPCKIKQKLQRKNVMPTKKMVLLILLMIEILHHFLGCWFPYEPYNDRIHTTI